MKKTANAEGVVDQDRHVCPPVLLGHRDVDDDYSHPRPAPRRPRRAEPSPRSVSQVAPRRVAASRPDYPAFLALRSSGIYSQTCDDALATGRRQSASVQGKIATCLPRPRPRTHRHSGSWRLSCYQPVWLADSLTSLSRNRRGKNLSRGGNTLSLVSAHHSWSLSFST